MCYVVWDVAPYKTVILPADGTTNYHTLTAVVRTQDLGKCRLDVGEKCAVKKSPLSNKISDSLGVLENFKRIAISFTDLKDAV